ncbi:NAD-dependent epimerase/dehydratase family protein [Daejeonella sp. H1SJ63]|uniref:polysaccharide biosynthesis C-terminal domain-containing protein n=1 Tax=Daejeonella sp. H1SJ63 TaxID=3034145 RepID=UPI0023EBFAE3|nr:NAD-dependent epimerase/dehydratase family protein [Daejeonella sp. H1SJ63]
MRKIGITGQSGFIGSHIFNTLGLYPSEFERVDFRRSFFDDEDLLDEFVANCNVIIHLAGLNRHNDSEVIFNTNLKLTQKLVASLERTRSQAHVIFSSTSQEENDNLYGRSKKESRLLLSNWAESAGVRFSGLVIPNVYGPFGEPYYNSVIATFCYQLTHDESSKIEIDRELKLIYVSELVDQILGFIRENDNSHIRVLEYSTQIKVSEVFELLRNFRIEYFENGIIPRFNSKFELNLFNTFRSYIDISNYYPIKFTLHTDDRGSFSEIIRVGEGQGGQTSFSTTVPGVTRGNHFHTRKIERFAVIKGEALIQLRKIGTTETIDLYLSGDSPAYVDMPIWYAHNIKNIGSEELYTIFWINEFFDINDPDTFFEAV